MNIGEKIRFFRERKGLSQSKMAELLEMSVQGYGNIERGNTNISYSRLELISKELEVKPKDIVGFAERNSFVNSNNKNFNNHSSVYQVGIEQELVMRIRS